MLWLSREEWALCYSLVSAYQFDGQLSLELSLPEAFVAVICRLEHEFGFQWEGVVTSQHGEIYPRDTHPVEVANLYWVMQYQNGVAPDFHARAKEALEASR